MRAAGLPVVEFAGNSKSRDSLVTKLLAKKESVAAQVFDRVRYRVVTERTDQIAPVVWHLTQTLFPFNYAVPGQTQNSLVRFRRPARRATRGAPRSPRQLQLPADLERRDPVRAAERVQRAAASASSTSSSTCRCGSTISCPPLDPMADELGRIVFSLVEFQVVDAATAARNEEGDSSHERYKRRQLKRVLRRLSRGLVVPKRKRKRGGG